jgi:hypothetical protein
MTLNSTSMARPPPATTGMPSRRCQASDEARVKVQLPLTRYEPVADAPIDLYGSEGQVAETGRGGAVTAAGLLAAGKVAVILDGLDEIPGQLRPVALRALSQQATFRVVVLTRSAEMAAAAGSPGGCRRR